ncbi:hypothetical protein F4819DRAFT_486988 [Hypoxylon fuscum]|nr:hypothetical protein F4819DRAFT_486988 [Hypoxylon fuscum]
MQQLWLAMNVVTDQLSLEFPQKPDEEQHTPNWVAVQVLFPAKLGGLTIQKRGAPLLLGGSGALCIEAAALLIGLAPFTFGISAAIEGVICAAAVVTAVAIAFAIISAIIGWLFGSSPSQPNTGVPTTIETRSSYGQWPILDFGGSTATSCDCAVT